MVAGISQIQLSAISFTAGVEEGRLGELPVPVISETLAVPLCYVGTGHVLQVSSQF